MSISSDRWADLAPRLLSAIAMIGVGGGAIWAGGWVFAALAVICTGLMIWELSRMTRGEGQDASIMLGLLAATVLAVNLYVPHAYVLPLLLLPALIGVIAPRRDSVIYIGYALVILAAGWALVALRETAGLAPVLWLLTVVVATDVAGYFVGRTVGGPKFWPSVSPRKTWSGTAGGWVAAALVGLGFHIMGQGAQALIWVSPLIAFAGQLGDIAESAIKRRMGVKDSSNLIPGHGGVLDRFDALAFAAILAVILLPVLGLFPLTGL